MGGSGAVLAASVVYIVCIAAWVFAIMTPFFLLIKKLGWFRVSPEVEAAGLDVSHHGGSACESVLLPGAGGCAGLRRSLGCQQRRRANGLGRPGGRVCRAGVLLVCGSFFFPLRMIQPDQLPASELKRGAALLQTHTRAPARAR
jgi:hypothetical protein